MFWRDHWIHASGVLRGYPIDAASACRCGSTALMTHSANAGRRGRRAFADILEHPSRSVGGSSALKEAHHSCLKATMGSTRDARLAGKNPAATATMLSNTVHPMTMELSTDSTS
jgi:hypothetical protein